jgi:hypothetical protein
VRDGLADHSQNAWLGSLHLKELGVAQSTNDGSGRKRSNPETLCKLGNRGPQITLGLSENRKLKDLYLGSVCEIVCQISDGTRLVKTASLPCGRSPLRGEDPDKY